jgi:NADP-dependent 3-hydroxy acid dehydrogenase YdfG
MMSLPFSQWSAFMAYVQGKIAVITGAASGIGRALALQLNRDGCELFLSDINEGGLNETVSLLTRKDIPNVSQVLDVASKEAVHAWADRIAASKGHVDIVINNAGVALLATVEECDYANLEWLMGINFWGVVYGTQAFLPLLRKSGQGHLVNLSSVFGLIAVPTQSAYNAAKFAVRGYTEALRQEMAGTNVHVCCVHPGRHQNQYRARRAWRQPDADARAARPGVRTTRQNQSGSRRTKNHHGDREAQAALADWPGRRNYLADVSPVPGQLHALYSATG